MKKVNALILIAILGVVGWALPAGAEKIRLTDDQLDEIMAGADNKGVVSSSITGDNAGGQGAAFGQPANLVFCATIPSGKCPDPKVVPGTPSANTPNANASAGSASATSFYLGNVAGSSAPPPSAFTVPPGPGVGGKNSITIIQVGG